MRTKSDSFLKKNRALICSFFLPVIIMLGYFIFRQMYPFGKSSLLTVDLGQQYIDFFAFFRRTLLHDPSNFFYSFSKALGGGMLGEWAYYLMSPFNLLLLFFPGKTLTAGIMFITLAKYGCAGLSFAFLLKKTKMQQGAALPLFSTSYALMGWFIANQLNLLWLDAAIFLPLIIYCLIQLTVKGKSIAYILMLGLMLIDNYYMGYMICLFLLLFFCWHETVSYQNAKTFFTHLWLFILHSLSAICLAAVILIPTFFSLLDSKGQYTQESISFKFEYQPLKMLSKFIIGSFNFEQMPSGYPNLFVGSLALIGFLTYFINNRFKLKERFVAFVITAFLFLSLCFEPLDLLWHGFQFPVWYPYRFSFIVSFWMIYLAARSFKKMELPQTWKIGLAAFIYAGIIWYVLDNIKKFSYISKENLSFTALFAALTLIVLGAFAHPNTKYSKLIPYLLLFLSVIEVSANAVYSLNNLSYLTQSEYSQPASSLSKNSKTLSTRDQSLYRTGQVYSRTKNDGLANGLNSGSYFSSALEKSIPDFYGMLGSPDGDNYVTYSNGTIISDALLNMKYFISAKDESEVSGKQPLTSLTEKPDLKTYTPVSTNNLTKIYRNPNAISLGYVANKKLKTLKEFYDNPINYQTQWLSDITNTSTNVKYFNAVDFNEVVFQNVNQQVNLTDATLRRNDLSKDAQVVFKFTPKTNDSYYLTLGSSLDSDNVTLFLNNEPLKQYGTFRHTVIVNIANHSKNNEIILTAKFKKPSLWLNNFVLYRLNNRLVKQQLTQIKKQQVKLNHASQRSLSGEVKVSGHNQIFASTIPYSKGWHVKLNGKKVQTYKVQGTFLGFDLPQGKNKIQLSYWPPYFGTGLLITLLTLVLILLPSCLKLKKRISKRR
ncbi:hypothetical protein FC19_GL000888 [Liquorilactobacillus aquaticus DSM 21051]|uniref:Integral membrane protein n=1 Tax=Liquorilactobacillus aquaticus DSM 21051 TaxID=1423725 RepID=A0A0R2CXC3_9LACO|nr:YfhO family protein [Liquorilactobacillus aquaticus]KRM96591.1 hypothetical protein FC19_GL000888 [Liquorilactobacillus aquaticus DSM 21051]